MKITIDFPIQKCAYVKLLAYHKLFRAILTDEKWKTIVFIDN